MLLEVESGFDRPLALARPLDECGERTIAVGPDDEAHVLRFLEQLGPESLRHASGDAHDRRRLHVALQLTETANHALLGMVTNRAGIDEDDIRALRTVDRLVAMCRELAEHQLG